MQIDKCRVSEEYLKIGLRRVLQMRSYKGEDLRPPEKTYIRKNGNYH